MKNKNICAYLISISFVLFSLLYAVEYCCFDINFYNSEHEKLKIGNSGIAEHIGISEDDLSELTEFTLDYLNDYDLSLDKEMVINGKLREVFTDDEKAHMVDVRTLNITAQKIMIISLTVFAFSFIYFIFSKHSITDLFKTYLKTILFTIVFFVILFVWILIDFDSFWTLFHEIFFAGNKLWILDLNKDILIMIVPPDFFNDLVIRIIIFFFIYLFVFALLLFLLKKRKAKNDKRRFI